VLELDWVSVCRGIDLCMAVVRFTSIRRSWCMPPIERNIQSTTTVCRGAVFTAWISGGG